MKVVSDCLSFLIKIIPPKEIEKYAGLQRERLLGQIADCSGVDLKTAEARLHNFLWLGVDCWILREYPEFVGEVQGAIKKVDIDGLSALLAEVFGKEQIAVEMVIKTLFEEIYRPEDLISVEGLARTWARQAVGLPERDKVDVQKTAEVIEECAILLENEWRKIVSLVETRAGENLRPLIEITP